MTERDELEVPPAAEPAEPAEPTGTTGTTDRPVREEPGEPKRRLTGRTVAIAAGRTTAGLIVAGVAASVAIASTFLTPPTWAIEPPSLVVQPTAAPQQLVCPGGALRLGTDTGEGASTASPLGMPRTAWIADTSVAVREVAATNAGTLGTPAAAEIGTVEVADSGAPLGQGLQTELVTGGIQGLALTACTAPASQQWLVAGATTLGRTSLLVLTNPSAVEAVVDIELYSEDGQVQAAGLEGIRLAPDEQRALPLNGFGVDLVAPVVRIVSTGGRVVAAMQQSIVRSLQPGGIDVVSSQRPETRLVMPGVRVQARGELAAIDVTEADHDDISPVLRLFAPGSTEVRATVALIPQGATLADALAAGEELAAPGDAHADHDHGDGLAVPEPSSFQLTLTPGLVTEHAIELVAPGDYTVVVLAEQPVVGAMRNSSLSQAGGGLVIDFAWANPAAPLGDRAVLALPRITDTTAQSAAAPGGLATPTESTGYVLWLVNSSDEPASVLVEIAGREPQTIEVAAGAAEWTPVPAESTLAISQSRGISAAVLAVGPGRLAQAPLQAPGQLASEVTVRF